MEESERKMVVVGASGHGIVALEAAGRQNRFEVIGFLDSFKPARQMVAGVPILGHPDQLAQLMLQHRFRNVFFGISDNWIRKQVYEVARTNVPDFNLVSIIHPSAIISESASIGDGTLILAGAIVNAGCEVALNCIINTNASLDHDSQMKPYASILPGVTTGGNTIIGECSCVCIGSTLAHRVTIGEHSVIGAGSVVVKDVPPLVLAYGVPAKVIRPRVRGERHF